MSSIEQRLSRPSTSGIRPTTSGGSVGFKELLEVAFSGDRNRFVEVVENVGLKEMMGHDDFGNTLLHLIAAMGDLKMVKLLLRLGLSDDSLNIVGQTAAMVAEDYGNDEISDYLKRKSQEKRPVPAVVEPETNDQPAVDAAAESNFEQDYLDAVLNYAILIGIDATNEPHLLHIAEEGLGAPLPPEWQERDGTFVNVVSGSTQCEHPNDEVFRQRVVDARAKASECAAVEPEATASVELREVQTTSASVELREDQAPSALLSEAVNSDEGCEYENDFEEVPEPHEDAPKLLQPILDDDATRVMMLLQDRLKLKTRDMERYGRQTHRAETPDFMPKAQAMNGSAYGSSQGAIPSKDRGNSGSPDAGCTLPSVTLNRSNVFNKSEFDRLMRRYMGFSSTQVSLSLEGRRQRQQAINEAMKDIYAKYGKITTSLRQFLDSKSLERNAATKHEKGKKKTVSKVETTMASMPSTQKERATQLSVSPLQVSARPPNNPWIHPRKFTTLFNPEHMRPSKAGSKYTKINPSYMEGRSLQSPSVSVPLYPSISPNRMSDDNDPFAYVLDPRRRHKLIAKQMERSDRPLCASPWSPELKKSGVWDRNGHLDCNAFLFGDKYVHYNRHLVGQMDLDEELKRKGVQKAEELLWPNPDPYRHIKKRGERVLMVKSP